MFGKLLEDLIDLEALFERFDSLLPIYANADAEIQVESDQNCGFCLFGVVLKIEC
jgi:hypothetical protein